MFDKILRRIIYKLSQDFSEHLPKTKILVNGVPVRIHTNVNSKDQIRKKAPIFENTEIKTPITIQKQNYTEVVMPGVSKDDIFVQVMGQSAEIRGTSKGLAYFYIHNKRPKKYQIKDGLVKIVN